MGFFSWKTQDTDESIPNIHSNQKTFTVYMHDHLGNVWQEDSYDGYGEFGGKDFYALLAEMNGLEGREAGIDLAYADPAKPCLYPNLSKREDWKYQNRSPENCGAQGFFYYEFV
jgi:hypothetical protein